MFFVFCFGKDSFHVYDFDEKVLAEEFVSKWISEHLFEKVILCESISEFSVHDLKNSCFRKEV